MWPIHILTRQGADTPLVCPSFFSDTASYRCALGLNHRLFLLTCHPTKKRRKKKTSSKHSPMCEKNKARGERGVSENDLGYLMSWHCQWFANSTLIICWSLSFIDFAEDTWHIEDLVFHKFQDSRSNKCSPTPQEPFVDLVFRWSNEGVASKAGYDLSSECGDLSNIGGWGEGAVRLGASRSSWTGSPIWKQKNFMEKRKNKKK